MKMSYAARRATLKIVRLPHGQDLPLPAYQSEMAAGLDLIAANPAEAPIVLQPGSYARIPTGLVFELPPGTEGQVRPRSGLAAKHGVTVLNAPGTIDADYRGEVQVLLINHGAEAFSVARGDRIAQLILAPVLQAKITEAETPLSQTRRGAGGFGSTGASGTAQKADAAQKKKRIAPARKDAKTPRRKARSGKKS